MSDSDQRRSEPLTQARSFEFHRSGGDVEPATPAALAHQDQDADTVTPLGPTWLIRRSVAAAAVCGFVAAVVVGAVGLLPWGFSNPWWRAGLFAVIGLLAGAVYGAVVGIAIPRSREPSSPTIGRAYEADRGA